MPEKGDTRPRERKKHVRGPGRAGRGRIAVSGPPVKAVWPAGPAAFQIRRRRRCVALHLHLQVAGAGWGCIGKGHRFSFLQGLGALLEQEQEQQQISNHRKGVAVAGRGRGLGQQILSATDFYFQHEQS